MHFLPTGRSYRRGAGTELIDSIIVFVDSYKKYQQLDDM